MGTKIDEDITQFVVKELKKRELEKKHTIKPMRRFTLGEEIFHSITLGFGSFLSIAALIILVVMSTQAIEDVTMTLYTASGIILFTVACLFHAFPSGRTKEVFERLVHASIYLFIVGIYSVFSLLLIGGTRGWILLGIQIGLALFGMTFKSIWVRRHLLLHVLIVFIMAISIFYYAPLDVYESLGLTGFLLLITGGSCYIIGLIFYFLRKVKYFRSIWYLLVLAGTTLHYLCAMFYIA